MTIENKTLKVGDEIRFGMQLMIVDEITEFLTIALETEIPKDVLIDGKRVTFDAQEEIVLRCGKASIILSRDGKIVIKGTHLLSRSRGMNKIKGGAVHIN